MIPTLTLISNIVSNSCLTKKSHDRQGTYEHNEQILCQQNIRLNNLIQLDQHTLQVLLEPYWKQVGGPNNSTKVKANRLGNHDVVVRGLVAVFDDRNRGFLSDANNRNNKACYELTWRCWR